MTQRKNELATLTQKEPLELAYSKEVKIRNLDSPDSIIEMLNYLYVLLNVKKENQLNEIEESVLNGVILNNFWNFTISEIKHAFRLAVAGKLNIELYQKLDSITFGKVLVGYNAYKQQKIRNFKSTTMNKEVKKLTDSEINAIESEFINKCVLPYMKEKKKLKKPKIDWATYAIFKHFWKSKELTMTKKEIEQYKKEALKYWKEGLKARRNKGERISLDEVMSNKTQKMYASCVALYHKADTLNYGKE